MIGLSSLIVFLSLLTITNVGTNYQTRVYGDAYDYIEISDTTYGQSYLSDCNNSTCKIGYENMNMGNVRFTRFHNPIICVSVPSFPISSINNVQLDVKKASGTISWVGAYYFVDDDGVLTSEDYSSRNLIGYFRLNDSTFSIDITDAVKSARQIYKNNVYICLSTTMQYGGSGELYINGDTVTTCPLTTIDSNEEVSESNYGQFKYSELVPGINNSEQINCYGYALDLSTSETFEYFYGSEYSDEIYCEIIKNLLKDMVKRDFHPRMIESHDSPIYPFERRIAFRIGIRNGIIKGYHFMKQCDKGQWCEKYPDSISHIYPLGDNPETIEWNELYSSHTIYFAISG